MNGKVERWFPLIIAVAITTANTYLFNLYFDSLKDFSQALFGSTLSLNSITIGFLATAQSILFSIDKKYVIQQLKEGRVYNKLINYFMSAINSSFASAILSVVGLILDFKVFHVWHIYFISLWVLVFLYAELCAYRVIIVFSNLLRSPD